MWFIAGKLLNIVVQILIITLFKNINLKNLTALEKILGWFLIEHIFEKNNLNSGKFFFVNRDFRNLITNIVRLIRNLIFWVYIVTVLELVTFIFIIILLTYLLSIHVYFFFFKKFSYKNFLFVFLFSFFLKKIFRRYSKFDLFFVSQPLFLLLEFICICFYLYIIFFIGYHYISNYKSKQIKYLNIKFFFIKLIFFLIFLSFLCFCVYNIFLYETKISNNIIQELIVQFLFAYTYFYYVYINLLYLYYYIYIFIYCIL